MYEFDFSVAAVALGFVFRGAGLTIEISVAALVLGTIIGLPFGIVRAHAGRILGAVLDIYIEVFRNIPALVQIVWMYYVLPILTQINLDAVTAGILALGLNTSAFLAEVFRGGILGVPVGQTEASASLGFTTPKTMAYVIVPQMLRKMLAPLLNQFIVLIKESALVAYIGVLDIMHRGDMISTQFARPLEAYTAVALAYWVICFGASRMARWLEVFFAIPD